MRKIHFEIAAVLLTGAFKFLLVDFLNLKFWFIILAGLFWATYIIIRTRIDINSTREWGFRTEGFWPSIRMIIIPAIVFALISIIFGLNKGHLILNWHILPIMILYPIWGTLQQFLIISLFGGNLNKLEKPKISPVLIIILPASLFSLVHYPSTQLIIATFILAAFYMLLFMRFKNLWALGIFHGWMACIFYFFLMGRDPWIEFIGSI